MADLRQRMLAVALGGCVLLAGETAAQGNAQDNVASPTTMIADMARELITKSYSNSQVLSLNLNNVLILLLIKAVLFGISQYSVGGKGFGGFWGRSSPSSSDSQPRAIDDHATESELLLVLSYLTGERKGDYGCLYRVVCEDPNGKAPQYLSAGRMLLKGARVMSSFITVSPKYGTIVDGMEQAIKHGSAGGQCNHYVCKTRE